MPVRRALPYLPSRIGKEKGPPGKEGYEGARRPFATKGGASSWHWAQFWAALVNE